MKATRYLTKMMIGAISMTLLLAMPVCAEEQKAAFKVADAIKSAIGYSNAMSINGKENTTLKDQMMADSSTTYYDYQSIYLQKVRNEQERKMIEDRIANDVTNKYNEIIILQKEIQAISKNIDISVKELKQMQIKNKNGLVNPVQYQSKEIDTANLKTSKITKEDELKNAATYFKIITGKDVAKYALDNSISYEPFRITTSVEGYIGSKLDIYLQYDKEIAKLNASNPPIEQGYVAYIKTKSEAENAELKLEDHQKDLKQKLITKYSSLLSLEEQISNLQPQFEVLDKQFKSIELRYKSGLVSVIEYDKQVVAKQDVEVKMLKLISDYNGTKEAIQKPWVMY